MGQKGPPLQESVLVEFVHLKRKTFFVPGQAG